MHYTFHYYPDPGIAFDITKMLLVKLHPVNTWSSLLVSIDTRKEDILFIQKNASLFSSPRPELLLFFSLPANKRATFFSTLLGKVIQTNFTTFSFPSFLSYFNDVEKIKKDIHSFYFDSELSDSTDYEHFIRTSKNIPDKIKLLLFGFYVNPTKYINYLIETLESYYRTIVDSFISAASTIAISDSYIDQLLKRTENLDISSNSDISISYSLSFTTPEFLVFNYSNKHPYLITTSKSIDRILKTSDPYSINSFIAATAALSEKQRILIINLLIEREKLTLNEISTLLNISKTAVQHHMGYLKRANLVTIVRTYRKATYYLNSKGFNDTLLAMQKLANGEKLR